jgi:hypothetical protein
MRPSCSNTAALLAALLLCMAACKGASRKPAGQTGETGEPVVTRGDEGVAAPTRSGPEIIVVAEVEIRIVDPQDGPARELYPRELAKQLGRQLGQSPFFVARVEDVPQGHEARLATVEVRVTYDLVDSQERGGRVAVAAIESQIDWHDSRAGDLAPAENVLVERLLDPAERRNEDGVLAAMVADSLVQVGHGLIAKEQVRAGGVEGVEQALAAEDVDLVLWGLDLAAERRLAGLFDQVVARLESGDEVVRNRALTALVALGDRRAVDALARRAKFDDHDFMHMVIEAVSALGGDDARDYLEFIASGHPERSIRKRAGEGLERLGSASPDREPAGESGP